MLFNRKSTFILFHPYPFQYHQTFSITCCFIQAKTSFYLFRLVCHYYNSTKAFVFHLIHTQCYFSYSSALFTTKKTIASIQTTQLRTTHLFLLFYIEFPLLLLLKLYACQKPTKDKKEEKEWMGSFTKDVDVIHNEPNQIRESR